MIPLFGPVPGGVEMMVILLVALVLFGLPLTLIALFLANRSKGGSATKDDVDELANEVAELRTQLEERDRTGQQEKE